MTRLVQRITGSRPEVCHPDDWIVVFRNRIGEWTYQVNYTDIGSTSNFLRWLRDDVRGTAELLDLYHVDPGGVPVPVDIEAFLTLDAMAR